MPDEPEQTDDELEPRTPGSVPSEGRTIDRPAPNPAQQLGDFLSRSLGYTR
jgi:hypothetical protein